MCNIAGYVGKKQAAPILIEMLRREEGFDAGFYTGIATVHNGKIHYRKLLGNLDDLLANTDAAELPGTVGIIHSRTKSGGPDAWSHPFVSNGKDGVEPRIAYVANGHSGIFKHRDPEYNEMADGLVADGYKLDSEIEFEGNAYNRLSNQNAVHMSDVMCALIAREIDRGFDCDDAMANAFSDMPGDIVGLLLSAKDADKIFWSKISRPMNLAFTDHGAYLATTTIAFLDDVVSEPIRLPVLSAGCVTCNAFSAKRYENPPVSVVTADFSLMTKIHAAIESYLSDGALRHIYEIHKITQKFLPGFTDRQTTTTAASYEALEALYRDGRIDIVKETVEGANDGSSAPYYKFKLKG